MNAIEIKGLSKRYGSKDALCNLNMTVPKGAIYGFIGENGSGKSTTQKIICGLVKPDTGHIQLFGKPHHDPKVRAAMGCLIELPGCFPNYSIWNNMMLQAANLGIQHPEEEIGRLLKLVRMEGAASNHYKNCSLGMKQRIGIAFALLGKPDLLILDEPINGLDTDGMRIMGEVLSDLTQDHGCTVLISSHILGELEKIATHYGIIRNGQMVEEMTAEVFEHKCPSYIAIQTKQGKEAMAFLKGKYHQVVEVEDTICVYDKTSPEAVVTSFCEEHIGIYDIRTKKIGLENYYMNLMEKGQVS